MWRALHGLTAGLAMLLADIEIACVFVRTITGHSGMLVVRSDGRRRGVNRLVHPGASVSRDRHLGKQDGSDNNFGG